MGLVVCVILAVLSLQLHQSCAAADGSPPTEEIKYPSRYFSDKVSSRLQYYNRHVPVKASAMADSPITSVIILSGHTSTPTIPATYIIINVNLNQKAGGKYIYLAYSTSSSHGDPITGLQVLSDYSSSFPAQNGFTQIPNDLAEGAGAKYIYLYYTKNQANDPIHHVDVVAGPTSHVYPSDDTWVRINQDTNEAAGGDYVYICYKEKP